MRAPSPVRSVLGVARHGCESTNSTTTTDFPGIVEGLLRQSAYVSEVEACLWSDLVWRLEKGGDAASEAVKVRAAQ